MKSRTITCTLVAITCAIVIAVAGSLHFTGRKASAPQIITSSICDIAPVRTAFAAPPAAILQRLSLRDSALSFQDLRSYDPGPAVPVAPVTIQQLRRLFERRVSHNENEYVFKPCLPEYELLLTLPSSPHDIQLALCFGCEIVDIYEAGSRIDQADFDTITPELVSLIKPLFPDDPIIQALK